jgi:RNA polymerase sigma-70 factor (ECF subfamily)
VVSWTIVEAPSADQQLFRSLYPSLRRLAAVVRPADADPDDIVQEALARSLAVRPLQANDDPAAYLRTAVVRVALNQRRSSIRRRRLVERLGQAPARSTTVEYPSDAAPVIELGQLDPATRGILLLTIVDGLSFRQAAEAVGCSEGAARARSSRALRQLRLEFSRDTETRAI